ncbi:MAG TPA: hypothetical protein VGA56_25805 [Opitutaceae bacterium]
MIPILGLLIRHSGENVVILEQAPDAALLEYFAAELGLRVPRVRLLPYESYAGLARGRAATLRG